MGRMLVFAFLTFIAFWILAYVSYVIRELSRLLVGTPVVFPSPLLTAVSYILVVGDGLLFLVIPTILLVSIMYALAAKKRDPAFDGDSTAWDDWKFPRVAVALTAWNDESSIPLAVTEFANLDCVIETIVVDNSSRDNTAMAAKEAGARVVIENRKGYGNVCIRGLREALKNQDINIVALAEGDMTFYASDIAKMIPYLENADMVVGTRTTYELTRRDSQMDMFMSWGNLFLATLIRLRYWDWRFLGRVRLTDVGCTFRVLRKESLQKIVDHLRVGEDYFSPHMILSALRNDLKIIEVPIRFRKRVGVSKGASSGRLRAIRVGLQMVREILS